MNNNNLKIYKVDDDSFVGIKFENENVGIYIPALYNIGLTSRVTNWKDINLDKRDGVKIDILTFLKTISIVNTREVYTGKSFLKFNKYNKAFESMLWLIEDYIKNGIYCEFDKEKVKNSNGRINWKITLKQVPYINNKEEFIYNSIIVDKKVKVHRGLTEIYKFCLQLSINMLGWILGINQKIIRIPRKIPKMYYCGVIKRELGTTFLDSKKEVLTHLLNIVQGLSDKEHASFSYGVSGYHTVFEKMINKMFGNVSDKSVYCPNATWSLANGRQKDASKLRPDTIMIRGDNYYILDAKYYDTRDGVYNNYPSSCDIQKQITYGSCLERILKKFPVASGKDYVPCQEKSKKEKHTIYNAFILPCNIEDSEIKQLLRLTCEDNKVFRDETLENKMAYFGYAEADWVDGEQVYEKVIGLYIDLKYLINNYQKRTCVRELAEIIDDRFNKIS